MSLSQSGMLSGKFQFVIHTIRIAVKLFCTPKTIYFWPDIEHCFNEVKRVLKTGGKFVIVNESDGTGTMDAKWESLIEGMHTYKPDEVELHLTNTGFKNVRAQINEKKHWMLVTAVK